MKANELTHCYLIDKLLNPQRSCILDIDLYLPLNAEEGNLGQGLNCLVGSTRNLVHCEIPPLLWSHNHDPDYVGASHIHGCRGYFFLHKFI